MARPGEARQREARRRGSTKTPCPQIWKGNGMRLNQEQEKRATSELLSILEHGGRSTSELRGTPQFHGGRTLSNRQIIRLLRNSGRAIESVGESGMYTFRSGP